MKTSSVCWVPSPSSKAIETQRGGRPARLVPRNTSLQYLGERLSDSRQLARRSITWLGDSGELNRMNAVKKRLIGCMHIVFPESDIRLLSHLDRIAWLNTFDTIYTCLEEQLQA